MQPYTYHLLVWLTTLLLATFAGFLLGVITSERRFNPPKRTSSRARL